MQAITCSNHTRLTLLLTFRVKRTNKAFILADTISGHSKAISIRNFIGETGTDSRFLHDIGNDIQAAVNCVGAGVVIDDAGRAMTNGIDHKYFGARSRIFECQKLIQSPP